jgi:hypothetical protein
MARCERPRDDQRHAAAFGHPRQGRASAADATPRARRRRRGVGRRFGGARGQAGVDARKRKAEEEQKAKERALEAENAAKRADNCARAKAHLRALEDGLRLARVNEKGEREILDDKGRAAETQRARAVIASDCK